MSNVVNKIKDAVTGHHHSHDNNPNTASTNHGPHNTNVANKADPRVDSDLDGRSGLGNYSASSNAGPHDSNAANKLDPRVDSDRDGSRTVGQGVGTGTSTHTGTTGYGSTGVGSTGVGSTTTHGPHNSNLLNKADPRVDSDRDGSRNFGAATGATGASAYGNTGYSGTGVSHGSTTTAGPHDSNILNKADPRVDSDRDGSRNFGAATGSTGASAYGSTGAGLAGTHHQTGTHHGTTGLTGTHGSHGTHHTGPAPNTAGPHSSDLLNKADPRVDSDLDGSKTYGGNATYKS